MKAFQHEVMTDDNQELPEWGAHMTQWEAEVEADVIFDINTNNQPLEIHAALKDKKRSF